MSVQVQTVPVTATLAEVAALLAGHRISCVPVIEDGRPVGMISERDVVREVAADAIGWGQKTAGMVMSHPLHVANAGSTVADAVNTITRHGVRRVPVITEDGALAGIVTQTDLLRAAQRRLQEYAGDLEGLVGERTAELRDVEQRRDDLVNLTAHDIKNSLVVVMSALDLMDLGSEQQGAQNDQVFPLIRRATYRIENLLSTLLDVNRLESGAMPLRLTSVPWQAVRESVLNETHLLANNKSVGFNRIGEEQVIVRCDQMLVERILLNLLDNAISAARPGTEIDIHAARGGDGTFRVRVGNRGQVIPANVQPTIFQKYQQGGVQRAIRHFGNWGLGLTFCRLAVERHGGTIEAISPYLDGEGAAFEFRLPAEPRY
jgi:signal transduction histidine kinase